MQSRKLTELLLCHHFFSVKLLPNQEELENGEDDDFDTGTTEFIVQVEKRRSIKVTSPTASEDW